MHTVNNLVIHCIDFRFRELEQQWIKDNLAGQADLVAIAGVSKAILDESSREVVLNQIAISQRLHDMKIVHLLDHMDCGAYGGSASQPDKEAEAAMHKEQLQAAADVIEKRFPGITVLCYIVSFDGVEAV